MMLRVWVAACRIAGVLTLVGLLVAAFTSAPNVLAARLAVPPDIGPAEAIVVLGASATRDGTLSDASLRRALTGIRLYREGFAPRLVFLGMYAEAEARARLAVSLGVERGAILTESRVPTTRDEAARMRVVLGEGLGVRAVLLVTDVLHMRRARGLFERNGLFVRPAPADTGALAGRTPEERLNLARAVGQEVGAIGYHKVLGYL